MYTEKMIRDKIINMITDHVMETNKSGSMTKYRQPVIGFASAHDPLYDKASEIIGYDVLHPTDLLPEAETVVSFFVPLDVWTVKHARAKRQCSNREWSLAYYELNLMIGRIMSNLVSELTSMGIKATSEPVTENFDHYELTTAWPHKTSACIAGIGTFGINRLMITPMGCAGRLGTVLLSEKITPTPRPDQENCLYKREGKCGACVKKCHTGALSYNSFNRFICNQIDNTLMVGGFTDIYRGCCVCSTGPCSSYEEPHVEGHHVWIGTKNCEELALEKTNACRKGE